MAQGKEEVAEELWELLLAAEEEGAHPRDILAALQDVQRRWMIENIDRVVTRPGTGDRDGDGDR